MKSDSRLAFLLGYVLGRQRRQRAGLGCLLIGMGLLVGCSASLLLVSAPFSWLQARSLAALPQPAPATLTSLPPGTHIILTAQLPPDLPSDDNGLALFYVEAMSTMTQTVGTAQAGQWQRIAPPPRQVKLRLLTGQPLLVQLPPEVNFLNTHQVVLPGKTSQESERRAVGYVAGQVLTMQGAWEGNDRFTASELYAGAPQDYLAYWRQMPGLGLLTGFICGGIALFLLIGGIFLRFIGG